MSVRVWFTYHNFIFNVSTFIQFHRCLTNRLQLERDLVVPKRDKAASKHDKQQAIVDSRRSLAKLQDSCIRYLLRQVSQSECRIVYQYQRVSKELELPDAKSNTYRLTDIILDNQPVREASNPVCSTATPTNRMHFSKLTHLLSRILSSAVGNQFPWQLDQNRIDWCRGWGG